MVKRKVRLSVFSGPRNISPCYADGIAPLPTPAGWFCVGFSDEVPAGAVVTRPLGGQDVVLYRTRDGLLRAIRPYCPHLGAHLGAGGRVEGEEIVCPFHGFAFAPEGACTRTGYGTRPPKVSLTLLPVRLRHGMIMVWHHPAGLPPDWEIPETPPAEPASMARRLVECAGHPQEVFENVPDTGHFTAVHGKYCTGIRVVSPFKANGTRGHAAIDATIRVPGVGKTVRVGYSATIHGLGWSEIDITLPNGSPLRAWLLPTPIAPWRVHLRFCMSLPLSSPKWLLPAVRPAYQNVASRLLAEILLWFHHEKLVVSETSGDVPVWDAKAYLHRPALAEGDGPFGRYRNWARQFYVDGTPRRTRVPAEAQPLPETARD
ncbi:Rieske 2Fe-2S domain-containing protein [Nonomuraea sp. NPDC050783]|uniref:Rieske 2Fe-2S domain-containing protein n=1 Tax=Nonomuraea sp. NPDC050783 TaxID=3154634 RepID=UPI0034668266